MKVKLFTDGGSRGNPGPSGIGGVIYTMEDELLAEVSEFIGHGTNNQAEYLALLRTLEKAEELGAIEVECYLDSQLVVRQMNREYKVKDAKLREIFIQIHNVVVRIGHVTFTHVYREFNTAADEQVNIAIDRALE